MRFRNLALILGLGAVSGSAFGQAIADYDNFDTYPSTNYESENWYQPLTVGSYLATEITPANFNSVKTIDWYFANLVANQSPSFTFIFYDDNGTSGGPGTEIAAYSIAYGNLTQVAIYSSSITLGSQMVLTGATSSIWLAIETPTANEGVGIGSTANLGTSHDLWATSSTGAGNSFSITNSPYGGEPSVAFAVSLSPEPCSMAILGFGAVGMIARRRRSKSA